MSDLSVNVPASMKYTAILIFILISFGFKAQEKVVKHYDTLYYEGGMVREVTIRYIEKNTLHFSGTTKKGVEIKSTANLANLEYYVDYDSTGTVLLNDPNRLSNDQIVVPVMQSQAKEIAGPGILQEYLGNIDNDEYFLAAERFNHHVLVMRDGSVRLEKKFESDGSMMKAYGTVYGHVQKSHNETKYDKWFIYDNSVYSIFQINTKETVELILYKYDSDLNLQDSTIILKDSTTSNINFNIVFRLIDNEFAILCPHKLLKTNFTSIIFDLNTNQQIRRDFYLENDGLYCSDLTFNKEHEFLAILEGKENFRVAFTTIDETKLISHLIFSNTDSVYTRKLQSLTGNSYFRSYKFHKLNDKEILAASLMFHSEEGMNIKGYQTFNIKFGSSAESNNKLMELKGLDNPELWDGPYPLKKYQTNKYDEDTHYQQLKEIMFVKDGSYLLISESHEVLSSVDYAPGSDFAGGHPTTRKTTLDFDILAFESSELFQYQQNKEIYVSFIDPLKGELKWSTKTKKRLEMITYGAGFGHKQKTYFVDPNTTDNVTIYFPDYPKKYDPNEKGDYMTSSHETTIGVFKISLSDGASSLKAIKPRITYDDFETFNVACSYRNKENQLIFCTAKRNLLMTKFSFKFHVIE